MNSFFFMKKLQDALKCHTLPMLKCLLSYMCSKVILAHTGAVFGRPFVKLLALCYQTIVLSVQSVCDVGVLWPNGWMDEDENLHGGRLWPQPHC